MVIKEWHCNGCGADFDSTDSICGYCGATDPYVVRAFRTAPGFKGDKTKLTDTSLKNFTNQYGLTDFSNNKSSKHEKDFSNLWKPTTDLVNDPNLASGVGQAELLRSISKEAAAPITSQKIVVGRDKQATR